MIQLSNPVRLAVRQEFASQFNAQLALACAPLGLTPFTIDFTQPGNYWDAPLPLEFLLEYLAEKKADIPALCLYSDGLAAAGRPGAVDGIVPIGGRVFVQYGLDDTDFESMSDAVQAAITGILLESQTDDWGGGTYRNDLTIRPGDLIYENGSLYRVIQFQMSFQVTAS